MGLLMKSHSKRGRKDSSLGDKWYHLKNLSRVLTNKTIQDTGQNMGHVPKIDFAILTMPNER